MENKSFLSKKLSRAKWNALLEQGRIQDALEEYSAYIKYISEDSNETNQSEINEEIEYCKKLLIERLKSKFDSFFNNKDYYNAVLCCQYIFEEIPDDEVNLNNYIKSLEQVNQHDLQVLIAKYYMYTFKKNICYKLLSDAYGKNKEYKNAIEMYKKYLFLEHKTKLDATDCNNIGCHYYYSYLNNNNPEDVQNALKFFLKTIELCPSNKSFLRNAIFAAMKCKNFPVEKSVWQKYFSYKYADKDDEFIYAAECMKSGDIAEWGKYYEARFYTKNPTIYPKFDKPRWSGKEDLSDKILLVHYEQGYGDSILSFGYIPRIVKMAKHVIFYVQNELYDLLKDNEYGVEIKCFNTGSAQKLNFDYHVPSMSFPIVLGLNKDNISVEGGYIKPHKNKVEKFKNRYFDNNKYKIGIAFSGGKSILYRDIPIETLLKLDELDNVQIYNFTKDIDCRILDKFKNNKVINVVKDCCNFDDTAAALENVDILISSDNGVLNLAGAIGKKTLGLFNYHYVQRWYDLSGEDCGWYKSVKPIVNNEYNDWNLSMDKAIEIIKQEMNK